MNHLCIHLSTCLSINPYIYLCIYSSIILPIYLSVCQSVYLSLYLSMYSFVCLHPSYSTYLTTYHSTHLSDSTSLFIYVGFSMYPFYSIYLSASIYPSIYLSLKFLCYFQAAGEINPRIFTVATLTGHVIRVYGPNYTAAIDNGPAWALGTSKDLVDIGDATGDPFEISRLRRDVRTVNLLLVVLQ